MPVLRLRRRFVASACHHLGGDRREPTEFLDVLSRARDRWNEEFRLFRIRKRETEGPGRPRPGEPFPFPPALQAVRDRWNARLTPDPRTYRHEEEVCAARAIVVWSEDVLRPICDHFWPPWLFPNWTGTRFPPPIGFVAACLIWNPKDILPESWVSPTTIQPRLHDPMGDPFAPAAWYWRQRALGVEARLNAVLDAEQPIGRERIAEAVREAHDEAAGEALAGASGPAWHEPIGYIPLAPGMSLNDITKAGAAAMELLGWRNVMLDKAIKMQIGLWLQEGVEKTEIAGRLGVDTDTIREWLNDTPGPPLTAA